jgi:integrase
MSKRSNGEGTRAKLRPDGRWYREVMDGYKPDGKRNRLSFYGDTERAVNDLVKTYYADKARGEYVKNSSLTMSGLFGEWFRHGETVKGWRDKTKSIHYDSIRIHLNPTFGRVKVQQLQSRQIDAFVRSLAERGYKPASIHKILQPLQGALSYAVQMDVLTRSPMDKVVKPPLKQEEVKFLTAAEQQALLQCLPDTVGGRAARFALFTGLREGEVCGLRWGDLDSNGKQISINRTIRYMKRIVDGKREDRQSLVVNPPKTDASSDVLPLGAKALAILEDQRAAQASHCLNAGVVWEGARAGSGDCYIFASLTGQALDPANLNRTLRYALDAAGLPHRGMHALRHTYLTNAANHGVSLPTLQGLARHGNAATTARVYLHPDKVSIRQAVDMLDTLT